MSTDFYSELVHTFDSVVCNFKQYLPLLNWYFETVLVLLNTKLLITCSNFGLLFLFLFIKKYGLRI